MRDRLITALATGAIAAVVGIGVALYMHQKANLLAISLATGLAGFAFGFLFKLRPA